MSTNELHSFYWQNTRYLVWRIGNPTKSFSDFYVEAVSRRLDSNASHATLGCHHRNPTKFDRSGAAILRRLRRAGLEPHHSVIDYGCGSLRVGRHLIEFLDPGRYRGMDLTARFFQDGLARLDPDLVREKSPELSLISAATLVREAKHPPDFILSSAVLLHVPRFALSSFLRNVLCLMGPRTRAYLHFRDGPRYAQVGEMTWVYPAQMLIRRIEKLGGRAQLLPILRRSSGALPPQEAPFTPRYLVATRG